MKILFIHQNFPAQFIHLAPALVARGHQVWALKTVGVPSSDQSEWLGVNIIEYPISRGTTPGVHPWVADFETKVIRAQGCFNRAHEMLAAGFYPDVVVAHPGWGESMFIKEIWPATKLLIYCEFFYHAHGADIGFDPEFSSSRFDEVCRVKMKNLNHSLSLEIADAAISPTHWQASTFPIDFQKKISVIHDGINTEEICPRPDVCLTLVGGKKLKDGDQIITFANRNFEPQRGFHIFMRALPEVLKAKADAQIVLIGGEGKAYGPAPDPKRFGSSSWKEIFLDEVTQAIPDSDLERVHFVGSVPHPEFRRLMQLSMVHVYLTYPFVLSWSLLESMSSGCAIIASDTAPLQEVIKHNETGRLFDFFDSSSLAREICRMIDRDQDRELLGAAAREFAVANYDLRSVCLPSQIALVEGLSKD